MSRLRLVDANLGYQTGSAVLENVNLSIEEGDFLLLAGANGAGKSTLVRSLLGVLPTLKGRREASSDLILGYVPQQLQLDAGFPASVSDVVQMGLWGKGVRLNSQERKQRVHHALALVSMEARLKQAFGRLSGGQKQRVLLARSLVLKPNFLLLDEPVSGVDARATSIILELLKQQMLVGTSIVLVSHQPLALRNHVNRSILVKNGLLEELPPQIMCSAEGLEKLWT
ncbi:MAG: metal ABC transporter ATP-binding protein [Planctomycetota bacterium]